MHAASVAEVAMLPTFGRTGNRHTTAVPLVRDSES